MSSTDPSTTRCQHTVVLSLDDAFRVLEAIEDARLELSERGASLVNRGTAAVPEASK